jgi:hypothetical protein
MSKILFKKSKLKAVSLLIFMSLGFVFVLANTILSNYFLALASGIGVLLISLYFLIPQYILLAIIVLVPALAGLEGYQLDISSLLKIIGVEGSYTVDFFFIARASILFLAIIEIIKRGLAFFKTPLSFVLLVSMALNAVSFYFSDYKLQGVAFYWFHLVAAFGAYFLGYFLFNTRKKYLHILVAAILSAIIPLVVGIKQAFLQEFFFSNDSALPRIQATFWHPNKLGSFLFIIIVIYLIFYLSIKNKQKVLKKKLFFLTGFLPLIFLLGFTFSRTSWITLAFAIFLIAVIRRPLRKPAALLGSFVFLLALLVKGTRDRIFEIFAWRSNNSILGRMEIWDIGFFQLGKRPWLGFGPGSFGETIKDARGSEEGNISAHSDVVRFLIEGGVVGLVAYFLYFLSALAYAFLSFVRYPKSSKMIKLFGKKFLVDFKLLGFIPFLLFVSMVPISLMETSTLDFIYQFFAWIILGSWLAVSGQKISDKKLKS